jgi:hypothetical protein
MNPILAYKICTCDNASDAYLTVQFNTQWLNSSSRVRIEMIRMHGIDHRPVSYDALLIPDEGKNDSDIRKSA